MHTGWERFGHGQGGKGGDWVGVFLRESAVGGLLLEGEDGGMGGWGPPSHSAWEGILRRSWAGLDHPPARLGRKEQLSCCCVAVQCCRGAAALLPCCV